MKNFPELIFEHKSTLKPQNYTTNVKCYAIMGYFFIFYRIRIVGIREMYKIAKEKKPALTHLCTLLEDGLFVAKAAYIHAKGSRNFTMLELFLDEGEVFAKAHDRLTNIKIGYLSEELKQRSENCKQWMDLQASLQQAQEDRLQNLSRFLGFLDFIN